MSSPSYIWGSDVIEDVVVIDGDTLDLHIIKRLEGFGFKAILETTQRLRLARIDCSETRTRDLAEKEAGLQAKEFAKEQIFKAYEEKKLKVVTYKIGKYGRYLCDVWCDQVNLNNLLVEKGLATKYDGKQKRVKRNNN